MTVSPPSSAIHDRAGLQLGAAGICRFVIANLYDRVLVSRFILLALFILPRSFVMALKPVGVAGAASAVTSGDDIATTTQHHAPSGSECPLLNSNNHVFRLPPI